MEKSGSPDAAGIDDVCVVQGRIVRSGGRVQAVSWSVMDASRHLARIMLAAMSRRLSRGLAVEIARTMGEDKTCFPSYIY